MNTITDLVSNALIDSNINYDEFVLVNNVLGEYDDMEEQSKFLKMLWDILQKNHGNVFCHL